MALDASPCQQLVESQIRQDILRLPAPDFDQRFDKPVNVRVTKVYLDLDMTIPTEPIGSMPRPQKLSNLSPDGVKIQFADGHVRQLPKLLAASTYLRTAKEIAHTPVTLINRVLGQFSGEERKRVGIHTCPGGDRDSTHSADFDYSGFLGLDVGNFYMQGVP